MSGVAPRPTGARAGLPTRPRSVPASPWLSAHRANAAGLLVVAVALLLWAASLRGVDLDRMTDLGLASVLPPTYFLAIAVVVVSFAVLVHGRRAAAAVLGLHVVAWVVIAHATTPLLFERLRYAWVWKHLGIVEYILRHEAIDPTIASLDAYHNWPGFFGAAALVAGTAGSDGAATAMRLAPWAQLFFNLLFVGALAFLLPALTADPRAKWAAIWLFALGNWVAQDYFAPQAMAYALALVLYGTCLRWLVVAPTWPRRWASRIPLPWLSRLAERATVGAGLPAVAPAPGRQAAALAIALVLIAAIVPSHQLTPIALIVALGALAVGGCLRTPGLAVIAVVLTVAWNTYGASGYTPEAIRDVLETLGRAEGNLGASLADPTQFGPGAVFVAVVTRATSAFVGLLAVAGWLRRFAAGRLDLPPTLLLLSPLVLIGATSYGGEILFRVYFFALPFMAFYGALLFYPRQARGTGRATLAGLLAVSGALVFGFVFAYFGKDYANRFSANEQAATEYLVRTAPAGSLVIEGNGNYPSRFDHYEQFVMYPLAEWPRAEKTWDRPETAAELAAIIAAEQPPAAYVVFTNSMITGLSRDGIAYLTSLERDVAASAEFTRVWSTPDARIYAPASQPAPP